MTLEQQMKQQFAEAREEALKHVEEEIEALFARGQETVDFRFDAFSMWGANNAGPAFWKNFPIERFTDGWYRAVWSLNKADALEVAQYVKQWNAPWEYAIAGKFADALHQADPDWEQNEYYNAYFVSFSPTGGQEHQIRVRTPNGHENDSWQWS